MESYINIETRFLALDRELHAILNLIRERHTIEDKPGAVSEALGAWGYDIDSTKFVDCLRSNPIESSKCFFETIEGTSNGFTSSIVVAELSVGAYLSPRKNALENTLKLD